MNVIEQNSKMICCTRTVEKVLLKLLVVARLRILTKVETLSLVAFSLTDP